MRKYEYHDVNFRGTIEKVCYSTTNKDGQPREKYALIYLPCGYGEEPSRRYPILYLMHGGGGNPDAWLDCSKIKNMLDYTIDAGQVQPLIVVFPSFYKEKVSRIGKPQPELENFNVEFFQKELVTELLPAVEGKYRTYAEDVTAQGLQSSYAHRGIGGFSMGGCTTWYAFLKNNRYFGTYVPLSGDCWCCGVKGGGDHTVETVDALVGAAANAPKDFRIYAATGTEDPAHASLTPQVEEMKKRTEVFHFSENYAEGNLHYLLGEGMVHAYEEVYQYLYNFLPYLFR